VQLFLEGRELRDSAKLSELQVQPGDTLECEQFSGSTILSWGSNRDGELGISRSQQRCLVPTLVRIEPLPRI
jgi:alpha-tubulin suppressor-like RCC1 family protein